MKRRVQITVLSSQMAPLLGIYEPPKLYTNLSSMNAHNLNDDQKRLSFSSGATAAWEMFYESSVKDSLLYR